MRRCASPPTQHGGAGGPRSMGVDFSMGMTNLGTSFGPHLTRRMGSADTARQLRVTTFDRSTSTTTNRPPDQHMRINKQKQQPKQQPKQQRKRRPHPPVFVNLREGIANSRGSSNSSGLFLSTRTSGSDKMALQALGCKL